jgi:CRISPR-associated protein Cas2
MISVEKRSPYKMGWLLVMFDLPVLTKEQRKRATGFRKDLLDDGYFMVQFSVYARACPDPDRIDKHRERLKKFIPPAGNVRVLFLTDVQWSRGECICGPEFNQGNRQMDLNLAPQAEFW